MKITKLNKLQILRCLNTSTLILEPLVPESILQDVIITHSKNTYNAINWLKVQYCASLHVADNHIHYEVVLHAQLQNF